jgi:hypothetical protein
MELAIKENSKKTDKMDEQLVLVEYQEYSAKKRHTVSLNQDLGITRLR